MKRKILFIIPIIILCGFLISLGVNKDFYYRFFKKSGEVYKINNKGNFEGRSRIYKDGFKIFDGFFVNGKLKGWAISYYDDGSLKSKRFYRMGNIIGTEFHYHRGGQTSFRGTWRDGKWYGSQYYYEPNGNILSYDVRDFRPIPNDFFTILYENGKIKQILGSLISENMAIYKKSGPEILRQGEDYQDIVDLYITVACPPKLKTSVKININNKIYFIEDLKTNIVKVKKAFTGTGKYSIVVFGTLKNGNKILKYDTLRVSVDKVAN